MLEYALVSQVGKLLASNPHEAKDIAVGIKTFLDYLHPVPPTN